MSEEDARTFGWIMASLGAIAVGAVVFSAWQVRVIGTLKIVALPPGEAPEEIRRAWIGVEIPLRKHSSSPITMSTVGVVSGKGTETATGYSVGGAEALAALGAYNPEALAWWKNNARHTSQYGYVFLFPTEVCEVNLRA